MNDKSYQYFMDISDMELLIMLEEGTLLLMCNALTIDLHISARPHLYTQA